MEHAAEPAPKNGPAPTEITFAYWALAPREIETIHGLVGEFEAAEPTIRITLIEPTDRYYDKLTTLFAAGTPPDAFAANYGRLGDFARPELVADVRPLCAAVPQVHRDQFVTAAYEGLAQIGGALGRPDRLYGLPRDWGPTNLLAYNRDALDAGGVPYPEAGWTWDEFAGACRRLTVHTPEGATKQYGAALCLYPYAALAWLLQNGGGVLGADGRTSALSSTANVEALRFLKGLVDEGVVAPPNPAQDDSLELLRTGRTAMAFVTPYSLGGLREEATLHWGLAPPLVGKRQATGSIPTGVALSSRSTHPEAAFRFMAFWATVGAQRLGAAGLCVPAWKPALAGPDLAAEGGFGPDIAAVLRQAAVYAEPYPISRGLPYEQATRRLRNALDDVFIRDVAPEVALREAEAGS